MPCRNSNHFSAVLYNVPRCGLAPDAAESSRDGRPGGDAEPPAPAAAGGLAVGSAGRDVVVVVVLFAVAELPEWALRRVAVFAIC